MTRCPLFRFRPEYLRLDLLPPPPVRCCGSCQSWDREAEACMEKERLGREKYRREVRLKNY